MSVEIPPFEAAIRAGVAAIMTAHVIFTPIDDKYPATMSAPVLTGLLRERLKYDGVVFSDDMQMKAIADHYGFDDAVVRSANAGVDLFWVCHDHALQNRAIDALIEAVESGKLARERVEQSNRRLDKLFAQYVRPPRPGPPLDTLIGTAEHHAVAEEILARANSVASAGPQADPTEGWR
jgi:beta-N-acetylhexosaminidase